MPLTAEEEAALLEKLGKTTSAQINDAITGRFGRFTEKELPGIFEKFGAQLVEKIKPAEPAPEKKTGDDVDARIKAALDAERRESAKRIEAIESERKREKQDQQREQERAELQRVLVENGVDPKRVRGVIALLHTEEQRIARNADGAIVFKQQRGKGSAQYTDELSIADGVKEWLGTEDGKLYLPAKGAKGSGSSTTSTGSGSHSERANGGSFNTRGADGKVDPAARRQLARNTLAAALDYDAPDEGE